MDVETYARLYGNTGNSAGTRNTGQKTTTQAPLTMTDLRREEEKLKKETKSPAIADPWLEEEEDVDEVSDKMIRDSWYGTGDGKANTGSTKASGTATGSSSLSAQKPLTTADLRRQEKTTRTRNRPSRNPHLQAGRGRWIMSMPIWTRRTSPTMNTRTSSPPPTRTCSVRRSIIRESTAMKSRI